MRAQKRDANESTIVEGLEDCGYIVDRHYAPDPFDLLVRRIRSPVGLRIEVKTPLGLLTESQEQELEDEGIVVVRSLADALNACHKWL